MAKSVNCNCCAEWVMSAKPGSKNERYTKPIRICIPNTRIRVSFRAFSILSLSLAIAAYYYEKVTNRDRIQRRRTRVVPARVGGSNFLPILMRINDLNAHPAAGELGLPVLQSMSVIT